MARQWIEGHILKAKSIRKWHSEMTCCRNKVEPWERDRLLGAGPLRLVGSCSAQPLFSGMIFV